MSDEKKAPIRQGPQIPAEARSGQGSINNAWIPAEVRDPAPAPTGKDLDDGPAYDPVTNSYGPAAYKTQKGNIRIDR